MVLLCGKILGWLQKTLALSHNLESNRTIVLTVIHTFGAVIEQLSLAFEIMVKCSHAGPSNKSMNIF